MKNFNWIVVAALSLGVVAADLSAQDSRERNYYYEILNPSHEPKSPVNGFAGTRVSEVLDRGLVALPGKEKGEINLTSRLLQNDAPDDELNLYLEVGGKSNN